MRCCGGEMGRISNFPPRRIPGERLWLNSLRGVVFSCGMRRLCAACLNPTGFVPCPDQRGGQWQNNFVQVYRKSNSVSLQIIITIKKKHVNIPLLFKTLPIDVAVLLECCEVVVFFDYSLLSHIPLALARRYVAADGMLQIMNVNLRDEGAYTCVAQTSLDEDNATALLTVLGESGSLYKNEFQSI